VKAKSQALKCALLIILLLLAVLPAGCGGATKGAAGPAGDKGAGAAPADEGGSGAVEDPAVRKLETPEHKEAATEAIRYAEDANTGSKFEVREIRVVDGWAMVALEETGVPLEEAVGFPVYLQRLDEKGWEVEGCGTGVTSETLPGAPKGIFK